MIEFCGLTSADCEEVSRLEKEIFGADAWSREDFEETLCCDYACYIVAKEDGNIIGSAGLRNMCGDADITNVLIRSDYRRRGIALKMLSELMDRGASIGARNFTLEVRRGNEPAIRLYEKLGFVSEGIRPGFYEHPKEDAVIMWKRNTME